MTGPGMSTHSSVVTSCPISAMGKRGASISGPMGSLVPGWIGGEGGVGIDGTTLNQAAGIWLSSRVNWVDSDAMGSLLRSLWVVIKACRVLFVLIRTTGSVMVAG